MGLLQLRLRCKYRIVVRMSLCPIRSSDFETAAAVD